MDVGAARRRVLGAISAPFEFHDDDDDSSDDNAVCVLGQVLSGGVFGFLFGIGEAVGQVGVIDELTAGRRPVAQSDLS